MVRTPRFHAGGMGSIPGQGNKIPHAMRHGQKKKKIGCWAEELGEFCFMLGFAMRNSLPKLIY